VFYFSDFWFFAIFRNITVNGLGLCEGEKIEVQMFNLAQMFIRIPMLKFSTNAPLLQNQCVCPA
jgi:hypothetical protein